MTFKGPFQPKVFYVSMIFASTECWSEFTVWKLVSNAVGECFRKSHPVILACTRVHVKERGKRKLNRQKNKDQTQNGRIVH